MIHDQLQQQLEAYGRDTVSVRSGDKQRLLRRTGHKHLCVCVCPHWQFVVEAFQSDHQPVLSSHQLVLQLSHISLIGWFCQVVGQNVDKEVKQNQTEEEEEPSTDEEETQFDGFVLHYSQQPGAGL